MEGAKEFIASGECSQGSPTMASPLLTHALHALGNKLLPVLVFSDLGLRRCQDPQLQEYFEKIRRSADEAREMVDALRRELLALGENGDAQEPTTPIARVSSQSLGVGND